MRGLRKRGINGALRVGSMMSEKLRWFSYFWIGIALAMGACVKGEMTPRTLPEPVQVWTRGMGSLTGLALLEEPPALAVGLTTGLLLMDLTSEPPQGKWVPLGWVVRLTARPHAVTLAIACLRGCPSLALYDPPYEQPQHVLLRETEPVNDLAFSPDGRFLAAVTDVHGFLWRLEPTPTLHWAFPLPDFEDARAGEAIAFTPDGQEVLVDAGVVLRVSVETGQQIGALNTTGDVKALAVSPDGRWAAGSDAEGITIWDLRTGEVVQRLAERNPGALAFADGGRVLRSQHGEWEVATGRRLGDRQEPLTVWQAARPEGTARLWQEGETVWMETATGDRRQLLETGAAAPGLAFSATGETLAYLGRDGTIRVLEVPGGQEQTRIPLGEGQWQPAWPDRELLRGEQAGERWVWDLRTLRSWKVPPGPRGVYSLAVAPDRSRWAVGTEDGTIWVGEVDRERWQWWAQGGPNPIQALTFSPDGRWVAAGSSQHGPGPAMDETPLRIWETASGRLVCATDLGWGAQDRLGQVDVMRLAFHPDNQRLLALGVATKPENTPELMKTRWRGRWVEVPGCMLREEFPLTGWPGALITSPDGRWLVIQIGEEWMWWDLRRDLPGDGKPGGRLNGWGANAVATFSPDGRWLAVVLEDGRVSLWQMPP
jgi:WD40 repeat protein